MLLCLPSDSSDPALFSPYETKHYRRVLLFLKLVWSLPASHPTLTCDLFRPDVCFCFSCLATSYNL